MDDSDSIIFDSLFRDSNIDIPDLTYIGSTIENQMFRMDNLMTKNTLDADQKAKVSQLKLSKLEKEIIQRTEEVTQLCQRNQKLQADLQILNEKYESMKGKNSQEMRELIELESLCQNRATFRLHPVDRQNFQNLRFRLYCCKSLTSIKWNYSELEKTNKLVGFVCNPETEYIKKFMIDLEKKDKTSVSKQLWKMIRIGAIEDKQVMSSEINKAKNKPT